MNKPSIEVLDETINSLRELEVSMTSFMFKTNDVNELRNNLLTLVLESAKTIYNNRNDENTVGNEADHIINILTEMIEIKH